MTSRNDRSGELRARAEAFGQSHLFAFHARLSPAQREELVVDIERIDFEAIANYFAAPDAASDATVVDRIEPAEAWPAAPPPDRAADYRAASAAGEALLRAGRVGAMTVAGGQGTRLGFDGPKGAYPISPVRNKPLFQLFAESIVWARQRYRVSIPWYVMTSPTNDADTRAFFHANKFFGLDCDDVFFFEQGVMPAMTLDGAILLDQKHRVALAPDGHGGSLTALARSGALRDMRERGIDTLSYFQVDNPLVKPFDPLFLGLHSRTKSQVSSLAIGKADDRERVGNFARVDGRLCVIEYSDLPEALARARTPEGRRRFDLGNIAVHLLDRAFLEDLTAPGGRLSLPWHRAVKKVPHVDRHTGQRIEPAQPNALKLERFVFDALPLAERTLLLLAERGEVFSPVKNAEGVDSAMTARRDMVRRAARWLDACGASVPRRPDGEPDCTLEISPLLAADAASLRAKLPQGVSVARGGVRYFE